MGGLGGGGRARGRVVEGRFLISSAASLCAIRYYYLFLKRLRSVAAMRLAPVRQALSPAAPCPSHSTHQPHTSRLYPGQHRCSYIFGIVRFSHCGMTGKYNLAMYTNTVILSLQVDYVNKPSPRMDPIRPLLYPQGTVKFLYHLHYKSVLFKIRF